MAEDSQLVTPLRGRLHIRPRESGKEKHSEKNDYCYSSSNESLIITP